MRISEKEVHRSIWARFPFFYPFSNIFLSNSFLSFSPLLFEIVKYYTLMFYFSYLRGIGRQNSTGSSTSSLWGTGASSSSPPRITVPLSLFSSPSVFPSLFPPYILNLNTLLLSFSWILLPRFRFRECFRFYDAFVFLFFSLPLYSRLFHPLAI